MNVIKRSGKEVTFDIDRIVRAVTKANKEYSELTPEQIADLANKVWGKCRKLNRAINVEEIQDMVEDALIKINAYQVSKHYIKYRYQKELARKQNTTDAQILTTVNLENEEVKQENSNKNPTIISTQRDYIAGLVSRDLTDRYLLSEDVIKAHKEGLIHIHDTDYFIQRSYNCCLVNLEDMLQNGTVISGTLIEKPHSFTTACNIATQIMAQVASQQYGGQTISLAHLAPFVQRSREKIQQELGEECALTKKDLSAEEFDELVKLRVKREVARGVQIMQYQINTLLTTNGQAPFVSLDMYLNEAKSEQEKEDLALIIEEVLNQRIQGVKNEAGQWITPAFPKLLYFLEEDNIHEGSKYWYLTELAAKCTAKRMVPDYISEKKMLEIKGDAFPCMGCRSFLSRWTDPTTGKNKSFGRFNKGVCSISLPDVALSSKKNEDRFWKIFDERLELCHKVLLLRYERLKGTPSDVAPILWQHGAIARLKKGEPIDRLLVGGYSTISLGYAGLWECVYYMTGKKLTDPEGQAFGHRVMQHMVDKCAEWNSQLNLGFSVYGTPLESTTYKFAKCLQERFGIIPGVTDKNYITNSYHIHVTEPVDAFTKLKFESSFQDQSTGGAISYIEVPNMQNNIPAVESVIQYIYDNIMYAELNTKADYCQVCGYDGEIRIVDDGNGKLVWECPNCGNKDQAKMNVARRTCGYIGTQFWNQGRTQEIKERVLHL